MFWGRNDAAKPGHKSQDKSLVANKQTIINQHQHMNQSSANKQSNEQKNANQTTKQTVQYKQTAAKNIHNHIANNKNERTENNELTVELTNNKSINKAELINNQQKIRDQLAIELILKGHKPKAAMLEAKCNYENGGRDCRRICQVRTAELV